jgi:hypothetical protein
MVVMLEFWLNLLVKTYIDLLIFSMYCNINQIVILENNRYYKNK